jgi:hypothetical protein
MALLHVNKEGNYTTLHIFLKHNMEKEHAGLLL